MENKTYFFGWENIKWVFRELNKMYSSQPSFYSKKRIESGIAFIVLQWGMIFFLLKKHESMSTTDFLLWAGIEMGISGYYISKIEQAKKPNEGINP